MTHDRIAFVVLVKFQSTHLHEVWQWRTRQARGTVCFNPHTYMRCDLYAAFLLSCMLCFNPHTYMRCDSHVTPLARFSRSFNPHTYMRCDPAERLTALSVAVFQSTHLHEVWLVQHIALLDVIRVSIHTPTWGVTLGCISHTIRTTCFNPHTYMRCDESAF